MGTWNKNKNVLGMLLEVEPKSISRYWIASIDSFYTAPMALIENLEASSKYIDIVFKDEA